jgi:hypothetical protein
VVRDLLFNQPQLASVQVGTVQLPEGILHVIASGILHNPFSDPLLVGIGVCDLAGLPHEVFQIHITQATRE